MSLRVGLAQIENSPDLVRNLEAILSALDRLGRKDAQLALFPECALTGFSAALPRHTNADLESALEALQARAAAGDITLVVPSILRAAGEIFNGGYCFHGDQRLPFYKSGLTASESGFFTPRDDGIRVVECHGFRLGLLICVEAEHPPERYVGGVDALLWPAYWGSELADVWANSPEGAGEAKIRRNMDVWQRPLLQANFSQNHGNDGRDSGPAGLSLVVDSDNTCVARGAHRTAGEVIVELVREGEGTRVRSVEGDVFESCGRHVPAPAGR